MSEILELKLENLEQTVERHDRLIEQLVQSQVDMKTGIATVSYTHLTLPTILRV